MRGYPRRMRTLRGRRASTLVLPTMKPAACWYTAKTASMFWVDEVLYETGLTNPDIAAKLTEAGISKSMVIIADSAEPKSIEELRRLGWRVQRGKKRGPTASKRFY